MCFLPFPHCSASFDLLTLLRKIKPATYLPSEVTRRGHFLLPQPYASSIFFFSFLFCLLWCIFFCFCFSSPPEWYRGLVTRNGTKLTSLQSPVEDVCTFLKIILMPWVTGGKKWLRRSGSCHACRGLSSNRAGMRLDKSAGKIPTRFWKGVDYIDHFVKMGLPRTAICRVCLCIETRKPQKEGQKADDEQKRCQKRRGTSSSRPSVTRRESPQ